MKEERKKKKKERWINFDYQNLHNQKRIAFKGVPTGAIYLLLGGTTTLLRMFMELVLEPPSKLHNQYIT